MVYEGRLLKKNNYGFKIQSIENMSGSQNPGGLEV